MKIERGRTRNLQGIGFVLRIRAHVMTFPDIRCNSVHSGAFGFVLRIRRSGCTRLHGVAPGCIRLHDFAYPNTLFRLRRRGSARVGPRRRKRQDTRKTARLLLHPDRARFGQRSRTTAPFSPEKRIKKFRILVSPFARVNDPRQPPRFRCGRSRTSPPAAPRNPARLRRCRL